jgi:hypothetical protein
MFPPRLARDETLGAFARFLLTLLGLLGLAALGHYGWGPFTAWLGRQ